MISVMRKLLVAVAIMAVSTACTAADEAPAAKPPENSAPAFSVTTFEGEVFSLAEQRGTPVVLNFWESW